MSMEIIEAMIEQQKAKLVEVAQMFVSNINYDDLLQPFDYPELENNPIFRYEEGILAGMQMMQAALRGKN